MKRISLTQGKIAIIDDDDYEIVSKYKWHAAYAGGMWYAKSYTAGNAIWMHRLLLKPMKKYDIDHLNGNGLDNRRVNLRVVTHAVNCQNRLANRIGTSKYKGVSWFTKIKKWTVRIKHNGKIHFLGNYLSELDAACAYDCKAKELGRTRRSRNFT